MAPRRKKPATRMDTAIDAMIPFGYNKELVQRKMKSLLNEYTEPGWEAGWAFIEADAYRVLLEAVFAEEEEGRQEVQETSGSDDLVEDERDGDGDISAAAGPSHGNDQPSCSETVHNALQTDDDPGGNGGPLPSAAVEIRLNELDLNQPCVEEAATFNADVDADVDNPGEPPDDAPICSLQPRSSNPTQKRRRRPCFGWISSHDEELDVDFFRLTPGHPSIN